MAKLVVALSLIFSTTMALAAPASAAPAWSVVASPSPPTPADGVLLGTDCPTTTNCFVAGYYLVDKTYRRPLVGRFNGTTWSIVKAPAPPSSDYERDSDLSGIACATSTKCFAVGNTVEHPEDGSAPEAFFVDKWNGVSWSVAALPAPAGSVRSHLGGVTCPTSTICFAVGWFYNGSTLKTLVERWNGTSWSIVPSPNGSGAAPTSLRVVSCATATNCLAVGSTSPSSVATPFAERWNGTIWSIVAAPIQSGATIVDLAGISCASTTMCFAVGSSHTASTNDKPLIERWNGTTWSVIASPNPTGFPNRLKGVSCPATTTCFATGRYSNDDSSSVTLVERWNGTNWSIVTSPNGTTTPGASYHSLEAVSCPTEASCVAVGLSTDGVDPVTLIERWNGTSWSVVPKGGSHSELQSVSCTSPSSCFAVGSSTDGLVTKTLVERWNGTSWSVIPSPNPVGAARSGLSAISCVSDTSCFAVGNFWDGSVYKTLIERWNGTSWVIVPSLNPAGATATLEGVACASDTSCFAVGRSWDGSVYRTLIERWDGTSWLIVPSPNPAGVQYPSLQSISCVSASNCFAVGGTLIERWNGTSWVIVASPSQAGVSSQLASVSCVSTTSCFAVGIASNASVTKTLVERWNGTSWVIVASPNRVGAISSLASVSCSSTTSCVAVGYSNDGSPSNTLVEQWNGTSWAIVASPSPSDAYASLSGVSCSGVTSCFAVGTYNTTISDWTLVERYS